MSSSVLEFHDSTVHDIIQVGTQVIVFLRAYLHYSEGRPAYDAGSVFIQGAVLLIGEAEIEGELCESPSPIYQGEMEINGERLRNFLPIPFHETGDVVLRMHFVFDDPARIIIKGSQAVLTLIGEPVYVEEFPGIEQQTQS